MTHQQERLLMNRQDYLEACRDGTQPFSSQRPGQPVCRTCRRGYGSELDGICTPCRGRTAWDALQAIKGGLA